MNKRTFFSIITIFILIFVLLRLNFDQQRENDFYQKKIAILSNISEEDLFDNMLHQWSKENKKDFKWVSIKYFEFNNKDIPTTEWEILYSNSYCTFARNSTEYAIFKDKKKMVFLDVGEKLNFIQYHFGVARGEHTNKIYILRFSSYRIQVDVIENENIEHIGLYDKYWDVYYFKEYDGKVYILIPSSNEYIEAGKIPNKERFSIKGNYIIIEEGDLANYIIEAIFK